MSTESESQAGGLEWSLGSYVFAHAFSKLAAALRWMFWGLLVQLLGMVAAGLPFAFLLWGGGKLNPKLVFPGMIVMTVGGILLIIGEQKCLHLQLPLGMTRSLPGHNWLRAAYWCHLGSWLLRIARNFLDRRLVAPILLPMQFLGFVFLLLFLRKIADVVGRKDLQKLVDAIFAMAGAIVISGALLVAEAFLHVGILKILPRIVAVMLFALPVILFFLTVGAYVILLGRMSSAAAGFGRYLGELEEDQTPDEDVAAS